MGYAVKGAIVGWTVVCFYVLTKAAKALPVSTVYAVFAGIGVAWTC